MKKGGNIDEALGFAQTAKEKMPKSAAVMDTLGWAYYLKGRYLSAISELQDSVELVPDNPVINFHLGMAYFKNNQPDVAREYLEKALKLDQNFEGAEEARQFLLDFAYATGFAPSFVRRQLLFPLSDNWNSRFRVPVGNRRATIRIPVCLSGLFLLLRQILVVA